MPETKSFSFSNAKRRLYSEMLLFVVKQEEPLSVCQPLITDLFTVPALEFQRPIAASAERTEGFILAADAPECEATNR